MKWTTLLSIATLSLSNAEVVNLTEENYIAETAGRNVFIKFFAPWCGHCKAMASDWEKLAADWKEDSVALIGEVDCTQEKGLCAEFEVEGYPTLYYGDPSSPSAYDGARDYASLSEFAKENLNEKICSVFNTESCEPDEKAIIEDLEKKSLEELTTMVTEVEKQAEDAEVEFEEKVKILQEQYETIVQGYNDKVESLKDKSNYKFLRAVLAKMEYDVGEKDGEEL